jgi:hypothetical protein
MAVGDQGKITVVAPAANLTLSSKTQLDTEVTEASRRAQSVASE